LDGCRETFFFLAANPVTTGNKEAKTVSSSFISGSVTVIWGFFSFIFPLATFDHLPLEPI
jgi:hypothetical protein